MVFRSHVYVDFGAMQAAADVRPRIVRGQRQVKDVAAPCATCHFFTINVLRKNPKNLF